MKQVILVLVVFASLLRLHAADEPLIPAALNAVLPKIRAGMTVSEVEAVLAPAYPSVKGRMGDWSGQTGYIEYMLDPRYTLSVSSITRDGKDVVHNEALFYLYDWPSKRRLDLKIVAHSIGTPADTDWPKGATVEVQLKLSAVVETNGYLKVSGDLVIRNPSDTALTIQSPHNRLVLAFLVFDPLGNLVAPKGLAKVNPAFRTHNLSAGSTYTHHFETLDFLTGNALFGYDLSPGKSYKILAVYRPAGPHGPGYSTQEVTLEIRQ
jgi:hypothetical protein